MSKAKLKKHFKQLIKDQLIEVVMEMYDARKEAKNYLEYYLAGDSEGELEKCKKQLNWIL